jgi:hypothetical protein
VKSELKKFSTMSKKSYEQLKRLEQVYHINCLKSLEYALKSILNSPRREILSKLSEVFQILSDYPMPKLAKSFLKRVLFLFVFKRNLISSTCYFLLLSELLSGLIKKFEVANCLPINLKLPRQNIFEIRSDYLKGVADHDIDEVSENLLRKLKSRSYTYMLPNVTVLNPFFSHDILASFGNKTLKYVIQTLQQLLSVRNLDMTLI